MSKCIECGCDMHPADASDYMECFNCRRALKRSTKVRSIASGKAEEVGRRARSSKMVGGACEMNDDGDDD